MCVLFFFFYCICEKRVTRTLKRRVFTLGGVAFRRLPAFALACTSATFQGLIFEYRKERQMFFTKQTDRKRDTATERKNMYIYIYREKPLNVVKGWDYKKSIDYFRHFLLNFNKYNFFEFLNINVKDKN